MFVKLQVANKVENKAVAGPWCSEFAKAGWLHNKIRKSCMLK